MRCSTCQKTQVFTASTFTLHHYHQDNPLPLPPLLIVFSMFNTPDILDIHPERSFIKELLSLGLKVYLMEWHADPIKNKTRCMAEYIVNDIDQAMLQVCLQEEVEKCHVMGVCQGGYFSLCLNAVKPERFASIIPVVTPIDFHAAGCKLYPLATSMVPEMNHHFLAQGVSFLKQASFISGKAIGACIQAVDPLYIMQNKYEAWQSCGESIEKKSLFYAIETWSQNYPDHPTQVIVDFFQEAICNNALVRQTLYLEGQCVNLEKITNPILNIYAKKDYFWSELTPAALAQLHCSSHYETLEYEGGHIGVFVSEKALNNIPVRIVHFMEQISTVTFSTQVKVV